MKLNFTTMFLFITIFSYSQEKTFYLQQKRVDKNSLKVRIEDQNLNLNYADFIELNPKPKGYFWISLKNLDSLLLNLETFVKTDTFYFEVRTQSFDETIIKADIIRKESHDTMHVVDFHFVNGELYTIQKSVNNLKNKYISTNNTNTIINSKAELLYSDILGLPIIEVRDSIFIYNKKKVEFLMVKNEYRARFHGFIGEYNEKYFFKNTFFYNLLDEISVYSKEIELETYIDIFYDSSSMHFVSQNYSNLSPLRGLPVYLFYSPNHKFAGRKYHKHKNTSIANLDPETAQVFKFLKGSNGFMGLLGLLEESRMDAYLLDSMLITFDFNKSEINYYINEQKINSKKIELSDLWYRNEFYTDEVRKKGYFLFRKGNSQVILEINYLTAETKEMPLLSGIHGLYHWEVNDGRLYILKKENPTSWKRILYSYNINDIRIN
ncbi:hypothetical protein [Brumimicrobium salinarum]|nr:hypothetical protein [Brumimicrobium salinarum]